MDIIHKQKASTTDNKLVEGWQIRKEPKVVAVTTPIPDSEGKVSGKTPIYQLPVYQIELKLAKSADKADEEEQQDDTHTFHCDLADLTDLIDKLKSYENMGRRGMFAWK